MDKLFFGYARFRLSADPVSEVNQLRITEINSQLSTLTGWSPDQVLSFNEKVGSVENGHEIDWTEIVKNVVDRGQEWIDEKFCSSLKKHLQIRVHFSQQNEFVLLANEISWVKNLIAEAEHRTRNGDVAEVQLKDQEIKDLVFRRGNLLSVAFDLFKHPFMIFDAKSYEVKVANRYAKETFGYKKGCKCHEMVHGFDEPCSDNGFMCPITEIWKTLEPAIVVHRRVLEGEERFFEVHAYPLIEDGDLTGIIEYSFDITDLKKTERALKKSNERYMVAVAGSNDGIWDWDLIENKLYLSPKWKEMIGYRDEELPNVYPTFEERIHPDDKPKVFDFIGSYLKGRIKTYAFEFRFRHRDGHYIWVLSRGEAIRDENGIPYRMAGSHTDITERKLQEEKLRKSEEQFRLLAENAQDLIFRIRLQPEQRFEYVSPSSVALIGYTPEEHYTDPLLGQKIIHPDDLHVLDTLSSGNMDKPFELRWVRKDGSVVWTEQRITPILDDNGTLVALEGVARDISERKKAELELQKKTEALAERVKELKCLYHISTLSEKPGISLQELLSATVKTITKAMFYPEICSENSVSK